MKMNRRKHRQKLDVPKTGIFPMSREQHGRYLLTRPCGDRCRGGMTLIQAFVRNLRTGSVMPRDRAQSGEPTRPKVPMHRPGAHCFVVAPKRSNVRGAKGAGHHVRMESTGNRRNSESWRKAAAF